MVHAIPHYLSRRRVSCALLLLAATAWRDAYAVEQAPFPVPPPSPSLMAQAPAIEGRISRMLINPYGEIDGMLLGERMVVKFPPHISERLIGIASPGQLVRVFGRRETADAIKADAIINIATGQTVLDTPPAVSGRLPLPPHLRAAQLSQLNVRGVIALVLTGPRGEANGVILDDGSIVRFAPDSVSLPLERGASFAAAGMGTRNAYGTAIEAISVGSSTSTQQPLYGRLR